MFEEELPCQVGVVPHIRCNHCFNCKTANNVEKRVKQAIENVCHKLGKPDLNGENRIINVNGMHWKELSEKFEEELGLK